MAELAGQKEKAAGLQADLARWQARYDQLAKSEKSTLRMPPALSALNWRMADDGRKPELAEELGKT